MVHRTIFFEENIPLNLEFIKMKSTYDYWQKEIQIVFLISGSVMVTLQGKTKQFLKNEAFLINSNELYSILSETEETELLLLHIDVNFIDKYIKNFSSLIFNIDNIKNDLTNYKIFNNFISKIFVCFRSLEEDYKAKLLKLTLELIDFLRKNYIKIIDETLDKSSDESKKISKISEYIDNNYQDYLSLKMLGDKFNMNPQYISRFFKQNVGMGFQNYLSSLRIKKSINDLLYSSKTIIEIALENGFSEGKNYSRAFKKEYEVSPAEFRKLGGKHKKNNEIISKENLLSNQNLDFLLKYLDYGKYELEIIPEKSIEIVEISADKSIPYEKNWKKIMAFGRAYEGLLGETQEQMRVIQKEIGFEYVRFTGIFNDEMLVYTEDINRKSLYNWNYVDKLLDFLQEVHLKPFINIGYMPELLARDEHYIFRWKGNVSFPNSMDKWNNLTSAFVLHLIERYGKEEVESWKFEIWNNPDFSGNFWYETREKYFEFFKNTLNSIKIISKKIDVGGPSGGSLYYKNYFKLWLNDLHKYLENNEYQLDFFSSHLYPYEKDSIDENKIHFLNKEHFSQALDVFNENINKNFGKKLKLIISEWNPGAPYGNYTHDTCFMATNIIYNLINIFDKSSGIAFWAFTDIFEEYGMGRNLFHGGYGLFTLNSLKKASYNAYVLMNKLGTELVDRGEGWIITKNEKNIQILMCNHVHFNRKFINNFYEKIDFKKKIVNELLINVDYYNRYTVFEEDKLKEIKIALNNLEKGKYLIKRTRLNKNSGSIFDAWLKMGAPENINSEMLKILKSKENMDIYIKKEEIMNTFEIVEVLGEHCTTLFEIEKQL